MHVSSKIWCRGYILEQEHLECSLSNSKTEGSWTYTGSSMAGSCYLKHHRYKKKNNNKGARKKGEMLFLEKYFLKIIFKHSGLVTVHTASLLALEHSR